MVQAVASSNIITVQFDSPEAAQEVYETVDFQYLPSEAPPPYTFFSRATLYAGPTAAGAPVNIEITPETVDALRFSLRNADWLDGRRDGGLPADFQKVTLYMGEPVVLNVSDASLRTYLTGKEHIAYNSPNPSPLYFDNESLERTLRATRLLQEKAPDIAQRAIAMFARSGDNCFITLDILTDDNEDRPDFVPFPSLLDETCGRSRNRSMRHVVDLKQPLFDTDFQNSPFAKLSSSLIRNEQDYRRYQQAWQKASIDAQDALRLALFVEQLNITSSGQSNLPEGKTPTKRSWVAAFDRVAKIFF